MQNIQSLNEKRRLWLIYVTSGFLGVLLICGLYWLLWGRFYEDTDDAYVNGNVLPIMAQVSGTLVRVNVNETQFVHQGESLAQIDPIDTRIRLQRAKASLANAIRTTRQIFIQTEGLQASIMDREATQHKAQDDVSRRHEAAHFGGVSKEELTHAEDQLKSADAALTQANAALQANLALTDNTTIALHPQVLIAAANLRKAYIDDARTDILAPVAGEIAKKAAQVGQRVDVGTTLMALVPLKDMWVDANFKEKQLRYMRVGQAVILTADLYGGSVQYHGKIAGFSAGTGSAFALLPAQNATGNWIKVVQRLPVRIALDANELKQHPLRIGLSMKVVVNVRHHEGRALGTLSSSTSEQTDIYKKRYQQADALVQQIIQENTRMHILPGSNHGNTSS